MDLRTKRIISLYSMKWLIFINETECDYCAVRTGSLNIINLTLEIAVFSPRIPGFDPRSIHVRFVVDKVALGQVFFRAPELPLSVLFHQYLSSPCQYYSTST
jgi:hypothetical protein